jgi:hypothetical protein
MHTGRHLCLQTARWVLVCPGWLGDAVRLCSRPAERGACCLSAGGRGLKPGQHAGLPVRAGAPALGRGLSIKGRLMKKLRLG